MWYNQFFLECLDAHLSMPMYNYMHGFPILTPGQGRLFIAQLLCPIQIFDANVGWYREDWKDRFLTCFTGAQFMNLEGPDAATVQRKVDEVSVHLGKRVEE